MFALRLGVAAALVLIATASPAAAVTRPSVSIQAATTSPQSGTSVRITGKVSGLKSGATIKFQRSVGSGYSTVSTFKVARSGSYVTRYVPVLGPNYLRVLVPKAKSRKEAVSKAVLLVARPQVTPSAPQTSDTIVVRGVLPAKVARPVELQALQGGTWVPAASGRASSTGSVMLATHLESSGMLRIVAPREVIGTNRYTAFVSPAASVTVTKPVLASGAPVISTIHRVGQEVTADVGTWEAGAVLTRQWLRDGIEVPGATSNSYRLTPADLGHRVSLRVTGTKPSYAPATRVSPSSQVIERGDLSSSPTPVLIGSAVVGETLTVDPGTWDDGVVLSKQWLRDGGVISGATGSTYELRGSDAGRQISARVAGSKVGYVDASRTSSSVVVTEAASAGTLVLTPTPELAGTPAVGQTLTVDVGTWDDGVVVSRQWLRDGAAVAGETGATYLVRNADASHKLSVRVTGIKPGYVSATRTSAESSIVSGGVFTAAPTPTISGQAALGETLAVDAGTWDDGVELTKQWRRNGVDIAGASSSTYEVSELDVGARLSVSVTGSRQGFVSRTVSSAQTAEVQRGTLQAATPTIAGTLDVGSTITAEVGPWGPGLVSFTYQWRRDGAPIDGATATTYDIQEGDAGSMLAVEVTGARDGYASQSRTSAERAVAGPQSAGKIQRSLRTFHAALERTDDEPLDILVGPSDSLADGLRATSVEKRWTSLLRDDLRAEGPSPISGGFGYADLFNYAGFADYPVSYVNGAGFFDQGLGRQTLGLFGTSQTITVSDRMTDLDIVYTGRAGSGGTFTYTVDDAAPVAVNTGGKPASRGGYVERISGLAAGEHHIVLRGGGGAAAIIEGVMIYDGDRGRGIHVWEGGQSGLRASDFVAPNDRWAESVAVVHPDLVVLPIGSNDYAIGHTAEETEANVREIIATIRAKADTDPSIVLVPYYDRPATSPSTWAEFEAMYDRVAASDPSISVFRLSPLFGPYRSDTRGGLMAPDLIHPSDAGYALIASELSKFLMSHAADG